MPVAKHPNADRGKTRQAVRDGALKEAAEALQISATEVSAAAIALAEVAGMNPEMTRDERIRRSADALIRTYLPISWDHVIAMAARLEQSSRHPEFAREVRVEVERRRNEQNSD